MVRPERIRVATDEASAPRLAVRLTVTSLVFQGPVIRLAGEAPDGNEVLAHIGPDQAVADAAAGRRGLGQLGPGRGDRPPGPTTRPSRCRLAHSIES